MTSTTMALPRSRSICNKPRISIQCEMRDAQTRCRSPFHPRPRGSQRGGSHPGTPSPAFARRRRKCGSAELSVRGRELRVCQVAYLPVYRTCRFPAVLCVSGAYGIRDLGVPSSKSLQDVSVSNCRDDTDRGLPTWHTGIVLVLDKRRGLIHT
jgi:hypothetical protein